MNKLKNNNSEFEKTILELKSYFMGWDAMYKTEYLFDFVDFITFLESLENSLKYGNFAERTYEYNLTCSRFQYKYLKYLGMDLIYALIKSEIYEPKLFSSLIQEIHKTINIMNSIGNTSQRVFITKSNQPKLICDNVSR